MTSNPSASDSPTPKLHIDTDWKSQARAEKEKLAEQAKAREAAKSSPAAAAGSAAAGEAPLGEDSRSAGGPPPADFKTLISSFVTQALFYLGAIPDPQTGQRIAHLDMAAHHIDMLGVLEQKTRGNLDAEESALLGQATRELRMHFLELSKALMAQQAAAVAGKAPGKSPMPPIA
jgi:hypothetical protein